MKERLTADDGMTLLEIVISTFILAIVMFPMTSSFLIGILEQHSTRERIADSAAAEIVAAWLPVDIEGSDRVVDPKAGTATSIPCQPSWFVSQAATPLKLQLEWTDPGTGDKTAAAYFQRTGEKSQLELYRIECAGSKVIAPTQPVVQNLAAPSADIPTNFSVSCDGTSPCTVTAPRSVTAHFVTKSGQVQADSSYRAYSFDIHASRRTDPDQVTP